MGTIHVVWESPARLVLRDLVAVRFRAFGLIGAQIHGGQAPLEAAAIARQKRRFTWS